MLIVALTGNIASGKSTVAQLLRERGAFIVDADVLARQAVARGTPGLAAIRDRWGAHMLTADGALDRAALRKLVFSDAAAREALNAIVHPEVERLRAAAVEEARARNEPLVVCDVPLLFENQLETKFDLVILVDAPDPLRMQRLVATRGLSAADAQAMMDAQLPADQKRNRSHFVLDNAGSIPDLEAQVDDAWKQLLQRAHPRAPRPLAPPTSPS